MAGVDVGQLCCGMLEDGGSKKKKDTGQPSLDTPPINIVSPARLLTSCRIYSSSLHALVLPVDVGLQYSSRACKGKKKKPSEQRTSLISVSPYNRVFETMPSHNRLSL